MAFLGRAQSFDSKAEDVAILKQNSGSLRACIVLNGRSRTMEDGSPNKAMESAASYSGSTNPGGTFKYLLTFGLC